MGTLNIIIGHSSRMGCINPMYEQVHVSFGVLGDDPSRGWDPSPLHRGGHCIPEPCKGQHGYSVTSLCTVQLL